MAPSSSPAVLPAMRSSADSSPTQSEHRRPHDPGEITIENLISYLVAAKRSLNCIHNVHRANSIIREARTTVESTAALIARTSYLRRSLLAQLKLLRSIQFELEAHVHAIKLEFDSVVKELDRAESKLASSLDQLHQTRIEDAFKQSPSVAASQADATTKDTLHDFIDEQPVRNIKTATKHVIDSVQGDQHEMAKSIRNLEIDLQAINELLRDKQVAVSATDSDIKHPNMFMVLRALEDNAHDMAVGLEGLVKHFDICVAAIKHTEGAGDAIIQTMKEGNLPEDMNEENLGGPAQPINDEERLELLRVVADDAEQVEEQTLEIQDQTAAMEAQLEKVMIWRERSEVAHADVAEAFRLLEVIGNRLSGHAAELARVANRWSESRVKVEDGIAGLEELCETYDNFLNAYDRLIVEAARRRASRKQMERVIEEAQFKLEQLYAIDLNEREHFREDLGDFLPSDIWDGLHSLPPRYGFGRLDGVEAGSIPELPRKTVDDALKRLKAGLKLEKAGQQL